jgi:cell division septal protein FtsQ
MIQKKHPHRKKSKLLFIGAGLLGILAYLYVASNYFQVRAVECYTQYGNCPSEYLDALESARGIALLKPLPSDAIKSKLGSHIEIKKIALYRRLPKTLVVSISLRKPLGTVGTQVLGARAVSDEEGLIISQSENSTLPFLLYEKDLSKGEMIDQSHVSSLKILGEISQMTQSPVSGKLENYDLTVFISDEQKVLLNLQNISPKWYNTLQVILERSKILSKIPKMIDLRFSDPVLTF